MDWGYLESKLSPGYPMSQNLKRQLRAFCKTALPRLQEMIREELAAEAEPDVFKLEDYQRFPFEVRP